MTFQELIKDSIFDLPIKQTGTDYFDGFLNRFFHEYLEKIDQLGDGDLELNGIHAHGEFVKSTQKVLVNGLLNVVKEYLDGYPSKAYNSLNGVLKNEVKDLYKIMSKSQYSTNNDFYRIRTNNKQGNHSFNSIDLFHIPFPLRGKVSTQRFSIPGFPSLYLGRTLYVCWEELNRPNIDEFQAIRLKNIQTINLLDLSPPPVNNTDDRVKYWYLMTWPLIACCSVKVKDYLDIFRPEYIVPQLLLQWVRDNDEIDGIRYKSNHIESDLYKKDGEFYNLVLPVKELSENNHCDKLKKYFELTEVISWSLFQFALAGQIQGMTSGLQNPIDKKLPDLELIKGKKYPYSWSSLGELESYLGKMQTFPII